MDDTLGRLRATSDECVKAYDSWANDKNNEEKREELQEAIHELRKVASRMEIDVAVSERQGQSQKQIPVPAHRSTRGNKGDGNTTILEDRGDDNNAGGGVKVEKAKTRRRAPKKAAN